MEIQTKQKAQELARQNKSRWQLFFLYGKLTLDEIMSMEMSLLREFTEAHNLYGDKFKNHVDINYSELISILNKMFGKR